MNDNLRERLEAFDDDTTTSYWKPEVGDRLVGEVVDWDVRDTKHAKQVPVLTISGEETGDLIEVWCLHTVLRKELMKLAPNVGDRIALRRLADGSNGQTTYRRFKALSDADRPKSIPWGSFGAQGSDVAVEDISTAPKEADAEDVAADGLPF